MTNIAYLLGFDSVFYDTTTRQFRPVNSGVTRISRNRVHVNKVLPTVQNKLARLCKNPPKYDVIPKSPDVEDKDAATLAQQVLEMIWNKQKINRKRLDVLMWAQQCGHAYFKVSFDDQLGQQISTDEMGAPMYEGDIRVDIVSPFEMFPDPLAKSLDECAYITQAKVRKLDYFKAHYPERGYLVKEENAWLLSAQYEARINSLNNMGPTSGTQGALKNSAIELSYYERRSKKHPNGRLIICANGVKLEEKELPVGEVPFAKFDDVLIAGKYYSEAIITHLRPIQDQYNRTISRRADWVNKLLAGKYIAAKGHGLTSEAMNDQSGEVLEYDVVPNAPPPSPMQVPNIPAYAYNEEDRLNNMFFDISGINEVSRGQLPSASIPAVGMQLLVEQDDTRIGIEVEQHEESYALLGKLIVMYSEKFYTNERLLKVSGRSGEYTLKYFKGEDINGNNDVMVVRGSTIPGSKTMKRQEVINLWTQGLLGPPQDPKTITMVLSMLEYGDIAQAWTKDHLDRAQIKKMIDLIESGNVPPEPHELDNHLLFVKEMNEYRLTDKYDKLSPEERVVFEQYMELHIQAQMKLMNPGIDLPTPEEAMASQGGPQELNQPPVAGGAGVGQNEGSPSELLGGERP